MLYPLTRLFIKVRTIIGKVVGSSKGKDFLMYLLFVFIAFIFWALLSLDEESTRDYDIPLKIVDVPDSVQLIGNVPEVIDVTVKSKGAQLLRYEWGTVPTLNLKFKDYANERGTFELSKIRMAATLRDFFGQTINVTATRPDSLSIRYTTSKGVRLPVRVNLDVHADYQYTISGAITSNVDSVTLYSIGPLPRGMKYVATEPFYRQGLKDTTRVKLQLVPIKNVKMVPSAIDITIPVEPLIAKKREAVVNVTYLPAGVSLITFPSKVTLSYLVPMSLYNHDQSVQVYVNYRDVFHHKGKLPVRIGSVPTAYTSVTCSPDSVEYIIENR